MLYASRYEWANVLVETLCWEALVEWLFCLQLLTLLRFSNTAQLNNGGVAKIGSRFFFIRCHHQTVVSRLRSVCKLDVDECVYFLVIAALDCCLGHRGL